MRADREVVVEIAGLESPTICDLAPATLAAIWASIRFLPMPGSQHQLLERYFEGPCAERNVINHLAANPFLAIPVGECEVRIRWANPDLQQA
ncbi:hypothetical protein F7Q99_05355 [Streptomyces kaniharaensis]|uniref:Uncharacterized protein n=1 Tax=Streptomyces kaniharaensis TaxID=212423 RepID=A0A6N7KJP4_9ACTN|nr:hypothetical protein [Streptomyces kaniharaensis]MQS11730.1 hypothetical protein [Streptomyces kaniharaensis]